jgi:hypothetical protein
MAHKRFAVLAAVLVALNVFLWLAPAGLALRQSIVARLFGPKLVRGEVIVATGGGSTADLRIDRGLVTSQSATQLTLQELDGRVQSIPLSASTRIYGQRSLQGWRVLVVWAANGTAMSVQPEAHVRGGGARAAHNH